MMTAEGVKRGTGIRRLAECDRWIFDGWDQLKGLPWEVTARRAPGTPRGTLAGEAEVLVSQVSSSTTGSPRHGTTPAKENRHQEGQRGEVWIKGRVSGLHMCAAT